MAIITKVIDWLGYTMGTSDIGDCVVYGVAGALCIIFVITIIQLINRILNITFFRGKE